MPIDDDVKTAAGTAAQIARDIMGRLQGDQIAPVEYEVEFHDLDGEEHQDWRVRRFRLSEGLSQCYETTLDLLNPMATANSDELLGQTMTLHITRAAAVERLVHGIVRRVDYIGITADNLMVRVHVVPAFRLLEHRIDCRIFQDQSVPEILEEVIGAGLGAFERELDMRDGLTTEERENHYAKRDFCVQYNESDLAFVSRLMEEEGISYFFEHDFEEGDGTKERLVLVDQRGDNPNAGCPEIAIIDPDGGGEVPIIADRADTADTESIQSFDWSLIKKTLKTHMRGFNWKAPDPEAPCEGTAELEDETAAGAVAWEPEVYLYGEHHKTVDAANDESFNGTGIAEDADAAVRCLELYKRQTREGSGRSNVVNLSPGHWFKLREHAHDTVHELAEFLLTRVIHSGDCPDVERQDTGGAEDMKPRYENRFTCIPRETKFRPAKTTPRPRIYGPQTATVTGSGNEEIHTDKEGRIKVKFHWDRENPVADTASCWVRVAQAWAGPNWGSLFIPRVGMEVVVEFLGGDPDNPLVTGCVYNGRNKPPYSLPDERTKSTIKTNSSPGGSGFNELRFEDDKGAEEVFLHAQKDLNEVIKNNMSTKVGVDQSLNVGNDRDKTIGGNETLEIKKDRKTSITGSEQTEIDGSVKIFIKGGKKEDKAEDPSKPGASLTIDGEYNVAVSKKYVLGLGVGGEKDEPFDAESKIVMDPSSIALETTASISLTVGSTTITMTPDKIEVKSAHIVVTGGANTLDLEADTSLESKGKITMKTDDGAEVELTANATLQAEEVEAKSTKGNAKVSLSSGDAKLEGTETLVGGSKSVDINGNGAKGNFANGIVKIN